MVVNSINFWLFFAATLLPYFLLYKAGSKWQNLWLLLASYFFYGWADWRMLPLLAVTTLVFYGLGIVIGQNTESNPKKAARYKTLGIIIPAFFYALQHCFIPTLFDGRYILYRFLSFLPLTIILCYYFQKKRNPVPIMVGHAIIDMMTGLEVLATSMVPGFYETMINMSR